MSHRLWYDDGHIGHAYPRLGEIHESRNNPRKALEYYARLVNLTKEPDPDLRARVDAAKRAVARLSGERSA